MLLLLMIFKFLFLIKKSFQAFLHFQVQYDIIKSDADVYKIDPNKYDYFVLDPWTWAARGNVIVIVIHIPIFMSNNNSNNSITYILNSNRNNYNNFNL